MALEEKKTFVSQQTGQVAVGTFRVGTSSSETSAWTYVETGFKPRTIELFRISTATTGLGKRLAWNEGMNVESDLSQDDAAGVVGSTARPASSSGDDFHCFVYSSAGLPLKVPCPVPTSSQDAIGTTGYPSSDYAGVYAQERGFYVGCSSSGILGERSTSDRPDPWIYASFYVTG